MPRRRPGHRHLGPRQSAIRSARLAPGQFGDTPTTGNPTIGPDPASTTDEPGTSTSTSTSTTGNDDATTVAPDPEACGNNVLDPGEQCDLGFLNNNDEGACTQA